MPASGSINGAQFELRRADDASLSGYDGKVIWKRDENDDVVESIPAGKKRQVLDSSGQGVLWIDEATGELRSTRFDDGAAGPAHSLLHDSASPAVDDVIGTFAFKARDSAGAIYTGAEIRAIAKNVTAGAQEVWFEAGIMNAGSFVTSGLSLRVVGGEVKLYIGGSEVGAPALINCHGYRNANFSAGSGSWVPVELDVELVDDDGMLNVAGSDPERMTCVTAGRFEASGQLAWISAGTTGDRGGRIAHYNSSDVLQIVYTDFRTTATNNLAHPLMPCLLDLSVGDYVQLEAYQTSGSAKNVGSNNSGAPRTWLTVKRLGD